MRKRSQSAATSRALNLILGQLSLLSVLLFASVASAQNYDAEPKYGEANLASGFSPDPYVVNVKSGGDDPTTHLPEGCVGFINAEQPDFSFSYEPSTLDLFIYVAGQSDTALLVNDPSGRWRCSDDAGGPDGLQPVVKFRSPKPGKYDVWVAEHLADVFREVRLVISELPPTWVQEIADDDFGDDAGMFARDGECDDPRFGGELDSHIGHDATDCRNAQQQAGSEQREPERQRSELELSSTGTGFVVSGRGHVVTNHHVIETCGRIMFRTLGTSPQEASVITANESADLALLKIETGPDTWARFRDGRPIRQGEEVVVFGFPLTGTLSQQGNLTAGLVTALSGIRQGVAGGDDLSRIQISAQIGPGNSGGPLMDRAGNIIGVVVATLSTAAATERAGGAIPQNLNFAIRGAIARALLDTHNVSYETASSGRSSAISDIGESARRFTGLIECYE